MYIFCRLFRIAVAVRLLKKLLLRITGCIFYQHPEVRTYKLTWIFVKIVCTMRGGEWCILFLWLLFFVAWNVKKYPNKRLQYDYNFLHSDPPPLMLPKLVGTLQNCAQNHKLFSLFFCWAKNKAFCDNFHIIFVRSGIFYTSNWPKNKDEALGIL